MRLSLAELPRALTARYGSSPPYHAVHRAAVNGRLPVERERGRWYADDRQLDAIAAALGLRTTKVAG